MKLTNPTEDELNAAFAERVAGWSKLKVDSPSTEPKWETGGYGGHGYAFRPPNVARSMDAVLPWLDVHQWSLIKQDGSYVVSIDLWKETPKGVGYTAQRAAVIALLRAHGVEVEFTS